MSKPDRLTRHKTRCKICKHDEQLLIETDYLSWHTAADIYARYFVEELADPVQGPSPEQIQGFRATLRLHADAYDLDARKIKDLSPMYMKIVEQGLASLNGQKVSIKDLIAAGNSLAKINGQMTGGEVNISLNAIESMTEDQLREHLLDTILAQGKQALAKKPTQGTAQ